MTSKKEYFASVQSEKNQFFSYAQERKRYPAWPHLKLQNINDTSSVVLSVKHPLNHLWDGSFYGHTIRVRFDDLQPVTYRIEPPAEDNSSIAFIEPSKRFIKNLKHSKKILIEATFFGSKGIKIIPFNVEGLKWNYKN